MDQKVKINQMYTNGEITEQERRLLAFRHFIASTSVTLVEVSKAISKSTSYISHIHTGRIKISDQIKQLIESNFNITL